MTIKQKPIWTTRDGRELYSPSDFDDQHLLNMIPFLARGIKDLRYIQHHEKSDDLRQLIETQVSRRLDLMELLSEEIRLRKLNIAPFEPPEIAWEKEFWSSLSYYDKPFN